MGAMDSHYDEFGNYIGPELSDESDGDDANDQQVRARYPRITRADASPALPLISRFYLRVTFINFSGNSSASALFTDSEATKPCDFRFPLKCVAFKSE